MQEELKFNICGIETSRYRNKEIEGFKERVDQAITPVLMYASQYWAEHLEYGSEPKEGSHPLADTVIPVDFYTGLKCSVPRTRCICYGILRKATGWTKVCHFLFHAGQ